MSYASTNIDHVACPSPKASLSLMQKIVFWARCAKSRRALRDLDAHLLRDIGVTESEAQSEAQRAPWDVPSHWHD